MPAFQRVALVGIDLVDHHFQRIAARDQPALHAIGGKAHVPGIQRQRLGHANRLLAGGFHEEAGLALTVRAKQAILEQAGLHHGPQALTQGFGIKAGIPRAVLFAQHPHQAIGIVAQGCLIGIRAGPGNRRARGDAHVIEAGGLTGPGNGLRNIQREAWHGRVHGGHPLGLMMISPD